ncbi:uncharacterized protein LOC129614448 [Condylostylus longicornis]|uniref:uncharacterized protein LOC129614448 n=1 Tax=Condylostylus longicornis TaxID=2530218 RepID=UPI00244DF5F6|nr:uncharacterized protein LOC129614448 [Condylostylus longicornis]
MYFEMNVYHLVFSVLSFELIFMEKVECMEDNMISSLNTFHNNISTIDCSASIKLQNTLGLKFFSKKKKKRSSNDMQYKLKLKNDILKENQNNTITNYTFMWNKNYEEANVSIIVDSEAGPISLENFIGNSHHLKNLTTTSSPQYFSLYNSYEDVNDTYEEIRNKPKNDTFDIPSPNLKMVESFWNNINLLNKMWNNYIELNGTDKIKREANKNLTQVEEGRYIKGDPLKGYYDFVITEGSYKFWAAFQLATAVLIIYSTFAAIYYSKVNPLVGDYDYVDYLGGGRSFTDESDFVDASTENVSQTFESLLDASGRNSSKQVYHSLHNLLPKLKFSLEFILDAVDKLPIKDFKFDGLESSSVL